MPIRVVARQVWRVLFAIFAVLFALHIFVVFVLRIGLGHDVAWGAVQFFDFESENSVPTWFSVMLLISASAASLLAGLRVRTVDGRQTIYWYLLAGAFCFLSIDEQAQVHELLTYDIGGSGDFYFSWVAVYAPVVVLFGLAMMRFLLLLPLHIALGFVCAGVIYVTGALGFEVVESRIADRIVHAPLAHMSEAEDKSLHSDISYQIAVTAEEALEMNGAMLYLAVALSYLSHLGARVEIDFPLGGAGDGDARMAMVNEVEPCPPRRDGLT